MLHVSQMAADESKGEHKISVRGSWRTFMGKGTMRRRLVFWIGLVLLLAGIAGGGLGIYYAHWAMSDHRFTVISEGKVYQSGTMHSEDLVKTVRQYGIRAVIDLRKEGEDVLAEHSAMTREGVKHFSLPARQVPADDTVDRFLDIVGDPKNRPVLIHCKHGEGRAPLFAAIYRIEFEGWSRERARRATRLLPFGGSFAPDRRKGIFLLNYEKRRSADTDSVESGRTSQHVGMYQ